MKLTSLQMQKLVEKVIDHLKRHQVIQFKADEKQVIELAVNAIKADYAKLDDLDKEVNKILDNLEKSNGGEFQRYKMFPLVRQKLAKERKIIL